MLGCVGLFFYVLPRASYGYIQHGFIPSAVWRFSNIFSSSSGGASPLITPPILSYWFPVQCYSQGYWYLMWTFPLLLKGLGVFPPSLGEVWGAYQLFSCPHAHSCTFFVVHYVSHFDHGSNYYPFSYSGIFWPVISVISDSGSFPDRVPVSHGKVPPPPLMPRGSGGVLCSISVPQQQTPSSMLLLAYANYAMGSPQVGFFFRVEPPTIFYLIYVWCLFWCLLFTFRCLIGCHIHLWGLNH